MEYGRLPTVAEYYREFIDENVNLLEQPKQCCFNHSETTPSFSYMVTRDRWSCFGKCDMYNKDVIDMHRLHRRFKDRETAEKSLREIYKIPNYVILEETRKQLPNYTVIENSSVLQKCIIRAKDINRFLELDLIMSNASREIEELEELLERWQEEDAKGYNSNK